MNLEEIVKRGRNLHRMKARQALVSRILSNNLPATGEAYTESWEDNPGDTYKRIEGLIYCIFNVQSTSSQGFINFDIGLGKEGYCAGTILYNANWSKQTFIHHMTLNIRREDGSFIVWYGNLFEFCHDIFESIWREEFTNEVICI